MNLSYASYDSNGNITAINNALDATKNKSFGYDALDRLTSGSGSWGSLSWTYDGVGNRQTQTEGASSSTYAYQTGTNKLTGITGAQTALFTFDPNGNTDTENTARNYVYNQNQRLISVVDGGNTKGEYTYNGNGQRVKKTVNGVTTVFHYDLRGQLIAESNNSGSITAEYVYLNGQPLTKIEGSVVYYYHNDHLGTPQKMTDGTGQVVWEGEFKPFGEAITVTGSITNNLRFPGQYYDSETGLNYNYFRDYNPVIGRYVEADRLGILGGENHLYNYSDNRPLLLVDPLGLAPVKCCPDADLSDGECCQRAATAGLFAQPGGGKAGGIVICCGGRKVACADKVTNGPGKSQILKCLVKHEEKHFDDVNCNSCSLERPPYAPGRSQSSGECEASKISVACLRASKSECRGNSACIARIDARIRQMITYGNSFGSCPGLE